METELPMIDKCIMTVLKFGNDHTMVTTLIIAIICIICYNIDGRDD